MVQADAVKVVNFLSKAKPDSDVMKGHIINSINALLTSTDPVSIRFTQIISEAMNRAAVSVLNESNGIPAVPQFVPSQSFLGGQTVHGQPAQVQATPQSILESIHDHAARLMI